MIDFLKAYVSLFYLGLHWVFVAVCKVSLVAVSRGHSLFRSTGFSLWWLLSLWSRASRQVGSVVLAPRPWHADSAVIVNCSTWSLPRPGIESMSLHWQSDSYPLRRCGSPIYLFLFNWLKLWEKVALYAEVKFRNNKKGWGNCWLDSLVRFVFFSC